MTVYIGASRHPYNIPLSIIWISYFQSTSNLHVCELDSGLEALEVEAKPKLLGLSKVVTKPSDLSWLKSILDFFTSV